MSATDTAAALRRLAKGRPEIALLLSGAADKLDALTDGLGALRWLEQHAVLATFGASGKCRPCCKFTAALLRGQLPAEAEHLRCQDAQDRLRLLRAAFEMVPADPGRERATAARPGVADAPEDPEAALWGKGCPIQVWPDGMGPVRCGLGGDRGTCATHGEFAKKPKVPAGAAAVADAKEEKS